MYNGYVPISNDFLVEMAEKGVDIGKYSKLGIDHSDPAANYCTACIQFINEIRVITAEDMLYEEDYTEADVKRFGALTKMVEEFLVSTVKLLPDNFISTDK